MAINDVAARGKGVSCVGLRDILREFLGHNFVSGLGTLKPKKPKKIENLKKLKHNLKTKNVLGFFLALAPGRSTR